jgi:hypothetical protein
MRDIYPEGTECGPRTTEPDLFPEPYPWCVSCGFQHQDDEHCPGCTGDHSQGVCMTPEAVAELARVDLFSLRQRVERAAIVLHVQVVDVFAVADELRAAKDGRR